MEHRDTDLRLTYQNTSVAAFELGKARPAFTRLQSRVNAIPTVARQHERPVLVRAARSGEV